MMDEKFYTPKQVAEILQVHQYTILKWIREGKLRALKFGRVYRTTESELRAFLGQTAHNSAQEIARNISTEASLDKFTLPIPTHIAVSSSEEKLSQVSSPPLPQEHEEIYSLNIEA